MHWHTLQSFLKNYPKLAIAFSGGLDSRFLAYAAKQSCCDVTLLHAYGAHTPTQETDFAKAWAKQHKLKIQCYEIDVLSLDAVRHNSKSRCYYCKKYLFEIFKNAAASKKLKLCDGTNADDLKEYRPGLKALKEHNISSPLASCNFNKASIRQEGKKFGLDFIEQQARPCLLTRLNYDLEITPQLLKQISSAELALEQIGLQDFRLRLCPEPILQCKNLNVSEDDVKSVLKKHGFMEVQIIISQNVSGFFDQPHTI